MAPGSSRKFRPQSSSRSGGRTEGQTPPRLHRSRAWEPRTPSRRRTSPSPASARESRGLELGLAGMERVVPRRGARSMWLRGRLLRSTPSDGASGAFAKAKSPTAEPEPLPAVQGPEFIRHGGLKRVGPVRRGGCPRPLQRTTALQPVGRPVRRYGLTGARPSGSYIGQGISAATITTYERGRG